MAFRVVLTRALEASESLARLLRDAGLEVLLFPTIRIEPLSEDIAWETFDWVAFTSANGVKAALKEGKPFPSTLQIAAIGASTARAIRERGYPVHLVPEKATGEALVEALLAVGMQDKRVVVPTSDRADTSKWERLREAGADVQVVVVYATRCETDHPPEQLQALDEASMVLFASPSAFRCFLKAVGEDRLSRLAIAAIGPTTRRAIEAAGFSVAVEPESPTASDLARAVIRYAQKGNRSEL